MPHADPKVKRAYMQAYHAKNRERLLADKRAKRLADPEKAKALDRAAYLRKDKAKKNARGRKDYAANKAREAARKHAFYLLHPEVFAERAQRRRATQRTAPVNDLTAAQWREIKAAYGSRCVYCGKKPRKLEQDHIQPLSKGGSHTASNVVPCCVQCNRRKGTGEVLTPVQPLLLTLASSRTSKEVA